MEIGSVMVNAGVVTFALQHRYIDGGKVGARNPDQGVCIQIVGDVEGREVELLRFDCFDQAPHYHYGPEGENARFMLDKTTASNPIGWTIRQLREKLPSMLKRAGYEELASRIGANLIATKLADVESLAREMALKQRNTVVHNRGDLVIEAGAIRFGLEYRRLANDRGQAIHVLGDVAGKEIELLAFDCFENEPHYHYGPRNKNERIYWDKTVVPDTLRWTLDQFKAGNLPAMIKRAGYPGIVAELDKELIRSKLAEVEAKALAMVRANAQQPATVDLAPATPGVEADQVAPPQSALVTTAGPESPSGQVQELSSQEVSVLGQQGTSSSGLPTLTRSELGAMPDGQVVLCSSHYDGIEFLKTYNAWGFLRINKTPSYLALYIRSSIAAIQFLGEVDRVIDPASADSPVGPQHPAYKTGRKLVILKEGRLWSLAEPIPLGANKRKAPISHRFLSLSQLARAVTLDDL